MQNNNALSVVKTGQTTTTAINTATAAAAIPTDSAGGKPKYLRFSATGNCYIRLANTAGAAVALTTDLLLTQHQSVILAVHNNTHWSAIDDGMSVKVNVTPLEDA